MIILPSLTVDPLPTSQGKQYIWSAEQYLAGSVGLSITSADLVITSNTGDVVITKAAQLTTVDGAPALVWWMKGGKQGKADLRIWLTLSDEERDNVDLNVEVNP